MGNFLKIALGVGCGVLLAMGAMFLTCSACAVKVATDMAEMDLEEKQALSDLDFEDTNCDLERVSFVKTPSA